MSASSSSMRISERQRSFKKGIDADLTRRRREDTTVQIRKTIKEDRLNQRRRIMDTMVSARFSFFLRVISNYAIALCLMLTLLASCVLYLWRYRRSRMRRTMKGTTLRTSSRAPRPTALVYVAFPLITSSVTVCVFTCCEYLYISVWCLCVITCF